VHLWAETYDRSFSPETVSNCRMTSSRGSFPRSPTHTVFCRTAWAEAVRSKGFDQLSP